jgi:hypothetical protein
MVDEGRLDAAGIFVPAVTDALARNPALSDRVRVGLIDFAGSATVRLPLSDLREGRLTPPELTAREGVSYTAAFTTLQQTIEYDVAELKAEGFAVHRPVVWFVCGAEPQDDPAEWQAAFTELTTNKLHPYVIPCGVGTARPDLLASLVHPAEGPRPMTLFLAEPKGEPAQAVTGIAELIISSMIQSGYGLGHANAGVILPEAQDLPVGIIRFEPHDLV